MKLSVFAVSSVLFVLVLAAGCRQAPTDRELADALFSEVQTMLEAGNPEAAIERLSASLADPAYSNAHVRVLDALVSLRLEAGEPDAAEALYVAAVTERPELAPGGFGRIYEYHRGGTNRQAVVNWTRQLIDLPLGARETVPAFLWHLDAVRRAQPLDQVQSTLKAMLNRLSPDAASQVVNRFVKDLLRENAIEATDAVLATAEAHADGAGPIRDVIAARRTEWLTRREEWDAAANYFLNVFPEIGDAGASEAFSILMQTLETKQPETLEAVCETVLESAGTKPLTQRLAANAWLKTAVSDENLAAVPERLDACLDYEVPIQIVQNLYQRHFYSVVGGPKPEATRELLEFGRHLRELVTEEAEQAAITVSILDAAFVLNDYEAALAMIGEGIPNQSETWHKMATTKLKAHAALQRGETDKAVAHFREFMNIVAEDCEEAEVDPTTGLRHTADMLLGRNAKRIGDILAPTDEAGSAAAYAEARSYYRQALEESKPDSREADLIREEMGAIPEPGDGDQSDANTTAP